MGLLAGRIWGLDGAHRQEGACEVGVSGSQKEWGWFGWYWVRGGSGVGGPDRPCGEAVELAAPSRD